MSMIRRKFNKEQKLEIVKQSLEESVSIEDLASQYKVHMNSIYKWRREYLRYEEDSFPGNGNKVLSAEQQEIERLKKQASFRLQAHPEQIDYRAEQGLQKSQLRSLLENHWLTHHQNLLFTGPTGCGKTWLSCAIGHHLCQQGIAVPVDDIG